MSGKIASAIISAIVGLLVGVFGSQAVQQRAAQTATKALDYVNALLDEAIERRQRGGEELSLTSYPTRPDISDINPNIQNVLDRAEDLTPIRTKIKILEGSTESEALKVVRVVHKAGGVGDNEVIEIEAKRKVDLSLGSLGDAKRSPESDKALKLPSDLVLNTGERVRLYTTTNYEKLQRVVELRYKKGIWKADSGEVDRVWLYSSDGTPLLDFEYTMD